MKDKNRKLRTRFGPDTRFEVPAVQLRAAQTRELELLKERLLLQLLQQAAEPGKRTALKRAANDAVALAWATSYPLLLLPTLLDEKADAALRHYQRQQQIRQRSQSLALVAA